MDINTKRELKRTSEKFSRFLEPLFVLAMLLVFAVPILAVLNLSPEVRKNPVSENVLGVNDVVAFTINSIGGTHALIHDEKVVNSEENNKAYSAILRSHVAGLFSKPVFELSNSTDKPQVVRVTAHTESSNSTQVGVIFHDANYVLQDSDNKFFYHDLTVNPGEKSKMYLSINNDLPVQFDDSVNLNLIVQ